MFDSVSAQEKRIKKILLLFFTCLVVIWGLTVLEAVCPAWLFIGRLTYGFFVISLPIVLYQFTYVITEYQYRRFPWQHYLIPGIYTLGFLIWLIVVRGDIFANRYEDEATLAVYNLMSISCASLRSVNSIFYGVLGIRRLIHFYYNRQESNEGHVRVSMQWLALHVLITTLITLNGVFLIMDFTGMLPRWLSIQIATTIIFTTMLIIASNCFLRKSLLFISITGSEDLPVSRTVHGPPLEETSTVDNISEKTPSKANPLTKVQFERLFIRQKLYLEPHLRITDLTDPLDTNRTYLSSFINRTYGVNFSRLVGRMRLEELERLKKLPSNRGKPVTELYTKAGFPSYRSYTRTKQIERQDNIED